MATSQNKYLVLTNRTTGPLPRLRHWAIADTDRSVYLRDGSAGFLLAHVAHWFDENIEKIDVGIYDDWGWAVRPVRGQTTGYSNHASGTAIDINATKHPRGRAASSTFTKDQIARIHKQLKAYDGCIRWGGDYNGTPDGMHFEINDDLAHVEKVARKLWQSKHGKPIIDANPGAASVIWDGHVPGTPDPPPPVVTVPTGGMIDYSYAKDKVDSAAVKKAGYRGVARYLSGKASKDLSKAEIARHHKAGLWVLPVFERSAGEALGGAAAGKSMRTAAEVQAKTLGIPTENAIIYAVDEAVTTSAQRAMLVDCFKALNDGNEYPVGVYGSAYVLDVIGDAKLATAFWQTTAWSAGRRSKYAQILQVTTHSRSISGLTRTDWDENLIIPGPVVPVWNPGEPARDDHEPPPPPPPPPPTGPKSTHLALNKSPVVKAHETSDHHPVFWNFRMDSGKTYWRGHWNLQGTDPFGQVQALIREALDEASIWAFNEATTLNIQNFLHQLRREGKINCFLPGVTLSADGKRVVKESAAGAVPIVWRRDTWRWVKTVSTRSSKGAAGRSPSRYNNRVLLEHVDTLERHWELCTHWCQAIEKDGVARKVTLPGQIGRGKDNSAGTVAALLADTATIVDGLTYAEFGSGDLNVDFNADHKAVKEGRGTDWFPCTAIRKVAYYDMFQTHPPTHGSRLIDQGFLAPAK